MYFGHITLSLAECLMHFFITNLIYGHVLLSPMSKYNEIKQKFNILYDVVIYFQDIEQMHRNFPISHIKPEPVIPTTYIL